MTAMPDAARCATVAVDEVGSRWTIAAAAKPIAATKSGREPVATARARHANAISPIATSTPGAGRRLMVVDIGS